MQHENYFTIEAETHFDLGVRKGELFGAYLRTKLSKLAGTRWWKRFARRAEPYLEPTARYFPQLIDEYRGYARGAAVEFDDLWTLDLLDELEDNGQHCTTLVANNGFLVAHNEDWAADAADGICLLHRRVARQSAFELFYLNTLGGNSISINSSGIVHSVNSLEHSDTQVGVPRNVIARWMSDTSSPDDACEILRGIPRAGGYHHTFVSATGEIWSLECSAGKQFLTRPTTPFVHTNHFLAGDLQEVERASNREGTFSRFRTASDLAGKVMSRQEAEQVLSDTSQGKKRSIFNSRTIARMVVDVDHMVANVWMARERRKGWLAYEVSF